MRLADNTLVVEEHNLDVIKSADWVIDLGPEGGAAGSQIIAEGRPEQAAKVANSHIERFLSPLL
jgi:excinuclease ABC subunit A